MYGIRLKIVLFCHCYCIYVIANVVFSWYFRSRCLLFWCYLYLLLFPLLYYISIFSNIFNTLYNIIVGKEDCFQFCLFFFDFSVVNQLIFDISFIHFMIPFLIYIEFMELWNLFMCLTFLWKLFPKKYPVFWIIKSRAASLLFSTVKLIDSSATSISLG